LKDDSRAGKGKRIVYAMKENMGFAVNLSANVDFVGTMRLADYIEFAQGKGVFTQQAFSGKCS
jgi:hypothetical protein